jgi:catechol 2,3-dioxygenase-like lactoylglutathione lyase family enzyme
MDDLENLRKRAKLLVRQHHAGVHVVAERLRRSLPRFAVLTDCEVLDADFALHDAQQVIATELGFASWADLKEAPPMLDRTPAESHLQRSLAQVFVTDFARALAFYRDTLGFDVVFTYGEPPFYGEVAREGAAFNLRYVGEMPFVAGRRDAEQLLSVAIRATDAKALFLRYQEAGVDFQERLRAKPWGADEFVIRDPDGNLILFGAPGATASSS